MNKTRTLGLLAATALLSAGLGSAQAATIAITEWAYSATPGEFIEFTNMTTSAIDMTGWSFDDDSNLPGSISLSSFGVLAAGQSAILTEATVAQFRADWSLAANIKVSDTLANSSANIGRADTLNLYDAAGQLVDRLAYSDNTNAPFGPRTQDVSGRPASLAAIGANNDSLWVLSAVGDVEGSYQAVSGAIGSPGKTSFAPVPAPVPLPAAAWLLLSGLGVVAGGLKRRKDKTAA